MNPLESFSVDTNKLRLQVEKDAVAFDAAMNAWREEYTSQWLRKVEAEFCGLDLAAEEKPQSWRDREPML